MLQTCARLCADSYDDNAPGFKTVGDLRYGVFDTEHGRIVVIRGTANLDNALTDARVFPARSCGGYLAHKGFVTAFRELCNGDIPLASVDVVTGHSLGGALATLLAERIGCKLVTFGSPRVYWRFGRAPQLDHVRVVRDDDPVQHVPKILYSHRAPATVLRDDDNAVLQVEDHFMDGYVQAVGTLLVLLTLAGRSTVNCTITGDGNRVTIEVPKNVAVTPLVDGNTVPVR